MDIIQCEVNNWPMRSRVDLTPYSLYYSHTNKVSYSGLLGKACKAAQTEYGLCLAKKVLDKIKLLDESQVMTQEEVAFVIKYGDTVFHEVANADKCVNGANLTDALLKMLQHFQYNIEGIDLSNGDEDDNNYGQSYV
jgi:hypothetical protein